jgi:hypothetical protein
MGNAFSYVSNDENSQESTKEIDKKNLIDHIDMIATNYVLKQNMIDMLRFTDKQYYDNLVILTSTILNKQMNSVDIGILKERVLNGNNNTNSSENNDNNTIYFSDPNTLKEITLKNDKQKKKALLLISKFYVKIITIFSAITSVIDPQYVYENEDGEKKYFYLKDFNDYKMLDKVENKIKISQLMNPFGLVKKRLSILKNKFDNTDNTDGNSSFATINPGEKFCTMNESDNQSLVNEVGIKELDSLYFDVYDYEENKWNKRSPTMEKQYQKDLLKFYRISTGKKNKPLSVKSFSDIETLKYSNLKRCKNKDYYKDLLVSKNDKLFLKYMQKIDEIQEVSRVYKQKLLTILKSIFVTNESNSETKLTIEPSLTMDNLMNFQNQTKKCILNIYTSCERLFIEALILYERMYENQYGKLVDSVNNNVLNSNLTINELKNAQSESGITMSPISSSALTLSPQVQNTSYMKQESQTQFTQPQSVTTPFETTQPQLQPQPQPQFLPQKQEPVLSSPQPFTSNIQSSAASLQSFPQTLPSPDQQTQQPIQSSMNSTLELESKTTPFQTPVTSTSFSPETNMNIPKPEDQSPPEIPKPETNVVPTTLSSPPLVDSKNVINTPKSNTIRINNNKQNEEPNKIKSGLFSIPSIFGTQKDDINNTETQVKEEKISQNTVVESQPEPVTMTPSENSLQVPPPQNTVVESQPEPVTMTPSENSLQVPSPQNTVVESQPDPVTMTSSENSVQVSPPQNTVVESQPDPVTMTSSENSVQVSPPQNTVVESQPDPVTMTSSENSVQVPSPQNSVVESQPDPVTMTSSEIMTLPPNKINEANKVGGHQEMFQQLKDSITSVFS